MKAKEITRREVRQLLEEIADRAPIMANRPLALIRKMFNFAIERDWVEANPCQGIKRLAPERQRDRVLSDDEIRRFWAALEEEHPRQPPTNVGLVAVISRRSKPPKSVFVSTSVGQLKSAKPLAGSSKGSSPPAAGSAP